MNNHEIYATCTCGNEQDIRLSDRCGECGEIITLNVVGTKPME